MARSKRGVALALVLAAAVVVADQVTKWIVRGAADRLPWDWILGLHLQITYNSGISFSRFADAGSVVVVLVAAVAVGVSIALALAPPRYRPALGVILGGALGNLIDRVHFNGSVLDFIGFYSWPQFNVADAAIVLGTIFLGVQIVFTRHE